MKTAAFHENLAIKKEQGKDCKYQFSHKDVVEGSVQVTYMDNGFVKQQFNLTNMGFPCSSSAGIQIADLSAVNNYISAYFSFCHSTGELYIRWAKDPRKEDLVSVKYDYYVPETNLEEEPRGKRKELETMINTVKGWIASDYNFALSHERSAALWNLGHALENARNQWRNELY